VESQSLVDSWQGTSSSHLFQGGQADLQIPEIPLRVLAGTSMVDIYRKPNIGMYQVVEKLYKEQGFEIDKENSIFVGDAAGRVAGGGRRKDHSNTDYQFAINAGLRFVTPEVSKATTKLIVGTFLGNV
jgi:DNA 3'-phosphatase